MMGDGILEKLKNSKPFILLLLTGAVYFFLKFISPLVAPVLIAMLFVTIFGNTLKKMQAKFRIHRQIGAIILLAIATLILAVLLWILFSWIVGSLPAWIDKLDVIELQISAIVQTVCETVGQALRVNNEYLQDTILRHLQEGFDYFQLTVVPGMLSHSFAYLKILGVVGGFLITFIIASVLLAKDYDDIMNRMLEREECHVLLEVICGIIRYIATFVKAQLIIISLIAGLAAVVLGIFGIRQGVLWGILAGIMDALPFIGTGIVLFPLAVVQIFYGDYGKALVCVLLYIGCIFLREFVEPRVIGKRLGIKPIAVLVSLYAGIRLFGIWGIIKGPLGFIIIYETYQSIQRRNKEELIEEQSNSQCGSD